MLRPCFMTVVLMVSVLVLSTTALPAEEKRDHDIVPEDYFGIGTITTSVVSPTGQYAVYVESRWGKGKEGRQNDLWCVDFSTKKRVRLTFGAFGAGHPVWAPQDKWIYFTGKQKRAGEEKPPYNGKTQVFRIAPTGGEPFPVTRVKGGIRQFDLARDGTCLFYTTSKEVHADEWKDLRKKYSDLEYGHGITRLNAIFKLDLESWRAEKVRDADRVIHEMALSPDRKKIALITTDDNELIVKEGWSRIEVLDIASESLETLTGPDWRKNHPTPYGWLHGLAWSRDSAALAFSISFDGYATRLFVADWNKGKSVVAEIDRPEIVALDGGLIWRGESRTLCFLGEARGCVRIYAIQNVRDGEQGQTDILTPGDLVVDAFGFDEFGGRLAACISTTTHMGDIFLVESGKYHRITNVNPQVDSWKLPRISTVKWIGADGDEVEGILELPPAYAPADGPLPLIVELHGGPTASTRYKLRLWIYGRALMAARGYALFSPNYHGSTGYGDLFTAKLIGRENEIEVTDILTGIDALIDKGVADRERIGVMGWSNGGYLTNCMITAAPDRFKAASSGAGILDMVLQWGTEDTPGHVVNFMKGLPWENAAAYTKASPLYDLGKVKTPTLIHVGGSDPRVPPAHSRALYRALHHYLKVPVELVVYPGEAHGLSTHDNRLAKMKWDLAWFDKYLPVEADTKK